MSERLLHVLRKLNKVLEEFTERLLGFQSKTGADTDQPRSGLFHTGSLDSQTGAGLLEGTAVAGVHLGGKLTKDDVAVVVQLLQAFRRGRCLKGVTVTRGKQRDSHHLVLADVVYLLIQEAVAGDDGADSTGTHEGDVNEVDTVEVA